MMSRYVWHRASLAAPRLRRVGLRWALLLAIATPGGVAAADSRLADYRELTRWAFGSPSALPAEGVEITLDAGRITLARGTVRLQSPLADGRSYGMVFEGEGRLLLEIPDPIELRQLRRFTQSPDLAAFEQGFKSLVLVTSEPDLLPGAAGGVTEGVGMARNRREQWLRQEFLDADAYVVGALGDPGGSFTRIDVETDEWGWVSLTYDNRRREELSLERFHPGHKAMESWVSLDRRQDRRDTGRPSYAYRPAFSVPHVDVVIDASRRARQSPAGFSEVQPLRAALEARVAVVSHTEGLAALRLSLSPWAEVTGVTDTEGSPLGFIRDHIGGRWSALDSDLQDDSLLVLLAAPLSDGERSEIVVRYASTLYGYAPGRSWYPGPEGPVPVALAPHTSSFEISYRDNQAVRASGELEWEGDGKALWKHPSPVKMASFAAMGKSHEVSHELDGVPTVKTFASLGGYMNEERLEQVGSDVASALHYFQQLFDDPLPVDELRSALIPAGHGQAFDGFLHIADLTVAYDAVAVTTLFRAHEVAHQWWGHRVLWASYRDQWLSEAFAEYSAMLFVHDAVEKGPKEFEEILAAYTDEVTGSLKSGFSRYARSDYTPTTRLGLERIGPIGHGRRCGVGEAPSAYFTQTYLKGALVLHMLRTLVTHMTKSNDTFFEILRTFVDRHAGGFASTEDFAAVLEEKVPADWSWFFDQWVYGAEIPTYAWSYEVVKGERSPWELRLHVEQSDVPPDFKMAIPLEIIFSGNRSGTALAFVDAPSKDFAFPLPEKPKKVVLNPRHSVLARMKKN